MPDLLTDLSFQAKALPPQERARLAEELLATLDPMSLMWMQRGTKSCVVESMRWSEAPSSSSPLIRPLQQPGA